MTRKLPQRALGLAIVVAIAGSGDAAADDPGTLLVRAGEREVSAQRLSSCLPNPEGSSTLCEEETPGGSPYPPVRARRRGRLTLKLGAEARTVRASFERNGRVSAQPRARRVCDEPLMRRVRVPRRARTGDVLRVFVRYRRGYASFAVRLVVRR